MKASIHSILREKGFDVQTVPPDANVGTAVRLMARYRIGSLVVAHGPTVVGVLSERHVIETLAAGQRALDLVFVREVMERDYAWVTPHHSVSEAMGLMTERYARHLPVLEDGRLVGLVSIGDLNRWVNHSLEDEVQTLQRYIVGAYH